MLCTVANVSRGWCYLHQLFPLLCFVNVGETSCWFTSKLTIDSLSSRAFRLSLQLQDTQRSLAEKKSSPSIPQFKEPKNLAKNPQKAPSSSTSESAAIKQRQVNLAEPFLPNQKISSTSAKPVLSSSSNLANVRMAAPVAAEPPIKLAEQAQNVAIPQHHIESEDVMEAPRVHGNDVDNVKAHGFNQYLYQQPQLVRHQKGKHVQQPLDRPSVHQVRQKSLTQVCI